MKYEMENGGGDNDRRKPNVVRNAGPSITLSTTNPIRTGRVASEPPR